MKNIILFIFLFITGIIAANQNYNLKSPNGKIEIVVNYDNTLTYSVYQNGNVVLKDSYIELIFNNVRLTKDSKIINTSTETISETITPTISYKNSVIKNHCNSLLLKFENKIRIEFRAYDNGVTYRFIFEQDGSAEVNEIAEYNFSDDYKMWASPIEGYASSYEVPYEQMKINELPKKKNTYLPLLLEQTNGNKVLIIEADLYDYPHMFLNNKNKNTLSATFPPFPLKTEHYKDRRSRILEGANYIAKTEANRSFPWRVMVITENDADLVNSELVYILSRENKLEKTDWIKPGRVSWEWWNASNLYDVDFEAGYNTESYKHYIDFASKYGLEYIILDEGWSVSTKDLSKPNPTLDLAELVRYGKEKNVRIIYGQHG